MLAALGFLTPFGPARSPGPAALRWFPLVGAVAGAVVGLIWWAASEAWHGPLVPAALAVAADLLMTGMLHVDGLADSADGLLPHLSRERRLEVMSAPDVGAFGLAATVAVLLLRFAAFGSLRPDVALVVGVWCVSRSLMVVAMLLLPYARPTGGLATAFLGGGVAAPALAASIGVAAGTSFAVWAGGAPAAAGVGAAVLAVAALLWVARRRLGGFTGDVLGAAVVVSETAALVVSGVRW
ncbi:MAG: adenosylcobinamide-GDP ribazoletransferase [Actinomycetota bacterium]|nr:adenosylcobinamide-GDP ribazoletransferase [Actinomycetota bacterium]